MKKVISLLLMCAVLFTISVPAFAEDEADDLAYLIVIRDADEEIVETVPMMARSTYVDGVYTIPADGSLTTLQYEPRERFSVGFKFCDNYGNTVTTRNRRVGVYIFTSATIGGNSRIPVNGMEFSTNIEDNNTFGSIDGNSVSIYSITPANTTRPYYNGVYKNLSTSSLDINILITLG